MRSKVTDKARQMRREPTEAEKALWHKINREQLGVKFRRQHPIQPYIVDFCCLGKGLVIELDGGQHDDAQQKAYDNKRTASLNDKGYRVLRFWNNEVLSNMEGVLKEIEAALNSSSLPPLSPLPQAGGGSSPWRADFPVLNQDMNGQPLAYLDSAASAQKPHIVIEALRDIYENHYANIHRGLYKLSQTTTAEFERARKKLAAFLGVENENEVVFTRNATAAINLVAQSWGRKNLTAGDEIILTEMEHHANIVPWQMLRDEIGVVLRFMPIDDDGVLDLEAYKTLLSPKTKLVGAVHISNALGTVNNVFEINKTAKNFNPEIKVLIDGSQAVVHRDVNIPALGCDFYVLTGHKLYAPGGVGMLWGHYDLLAAMPPYQGGGDMIETVSLEKTVYKAPPARFEAGTPAIAEVIGLGAAVDYLQTIGMEAIETHEKALYDYAMTQLQKIGGLHFYGNARDKAGIISFTADWGHISDVAMILDQCGVAVRTGHHCCMPLMQRFGIEGTIRASLGLYSNEADIDALVAGLNKAKQMLA